MKKSGFSLVEVALAILLLSLGLVSIFALFPLGLQQSDAAIQDTQEAMFVDYVFNTIEGNCLAITNWSDWSSTYDKFIKKAFAGLVYTDKDGKVKNMSISDVSFSLSDDPKVIQYPDPGEDGFARYLRFRLAVSDLDKSGTLKQIQLEVKSGKYGNFNTSYPQCYTTRVVFNGM